MAEIVWPAADDVESTVDMLKDKVSDHHTALYGNGKDGVLDFVASIKGQARLLITLAVIFGTLFTGGLLIIAYADLIKR